MRSNVKHFAIVTVLIVVVTAAVAVALDSIQLLPQLASAEGTIIDWLFGVHLNLIAFLFALVMVFMIYSIIVFRRQPGDEGDGRYIHGHPTLEIAWTIVPSLIVAYIGYLGVVTLREVTAASPDELTVEVNGMQWSWRFDYPEFGITSPDLVLPVNRPIRFVITSSDVIHSFWVPEFRMKQDAVPGAVHELHLTPTRIGNYRVRCAEICGLQHATMLADVRVVDLGAFRAWTVDNSEQSSDHETPETRGAQLYETQGCKACHSLDGTILVGPSWKNIYGSEESLEGGDSITVDEAYLRESILDPNAKIVQGFAPNVMPPTYRDMLSDQDIEDIVAYIKSLQD